MTHNLFTDLLKILLNQILYFLSIYPPEFFIQEKRYAILCWKPRHSVVCEYIERMAHSMSALLENGSFDEFYVSVLRDNSENVVLNYILTSSKLSNLEAENGDFLTWQVRALIQSFQLRLQQSFIKLNYKGLLTLKFFLKSNKETSISNDFLVFPWILSSKRIIFSVPRFVADLSIEDTNLTIFEEIL